MRRLLLATVLLAACGGDLPRYSEVEDLRVLAMRAVPPAYLFDETTTDLVFEALVVDPRGGAVDYRWSFCPLESSRACDDYEAEKAPVDDEWGAVLDAARAVSATGTALPMPADPSLPAAEPSRPYAVARFTVPRDVLASLQPYYLWDGFYGFGTGAWPSAVLELSRGGETLVGQKRAVASIADLAPYNPLVREYLGYYFCTDGLAPEELESCLPWRPELAGNDNPVFAGFEWSAGDSALADWQPLPGGAPLSVAPGGTVRIRPSFTPDSAQSYQLIRSDLETQVIELVDATEEISVSWFCSAGEVQDELTWPNFTKTLDTVYTAPPASPAATGGIVTLWLVARDQRGGVSWAHLDLIVEP